MRARRLGVGGGGGHTSWRVFPLLVEGWGGNGLSGKEWGDGFCSCYIMAWEMHFRVSPLGGDGYPHTEGLSPAVLLVWGILLRTRSRRRNWNSCLHCSMRTRKRYRRDLAMLGLRKVNCVEAQQNLMLSPAASRSLLRSVSPRDRPKPQNIDERRSSSRRSLGKAKRFVHGVISSLLLHIQSEHVGKGSLEESRG